MDLIAYNKMAAPSPLLPSSPRIRPTMQLLHELALTLTINEPFDFMLTVAKPAG